MKYGEYCGMAKKCSSWKSVAGATTPAAVHSAMNTMQVRYVTPTRITRAKSA